MLRVDSVISLITFFLAFVLFQSKTYSQEDIRLKVYTTTPISVDTSFYKELYRASDTNDRIVILTKIANAHTKNGNADSILRYAIFIKDIAISPDNKLTNRTHHRLTAQRLLGHGKYLKGLYNEALQAYIEGITIADSTTYHVEHDFVKLGLAEVYLQQKAYNKASPLFSELITSQTDPAVVRYAHFYLGTIAFEKGDFSFAKEYYTKALAIVVPEEDQKFNLWLQLNLGQLAAEENKNNKAFTSYEAIMNTALNAHYFDVYTEAVLAYGSLCIKIENYDLAEVTLTTAYTSALQWNRLELQKKIIKKLQLIYRAKGDYENAYNLITQYTAVSEQIIEEQNSKALKEIEVKYQTLQKENQIYELEEEQRSKQNEIERQKTIKKALLYGFLALLIPVLILLIVYYQKLQTQSQLNQQQKELNSQKITALLNSQELELVTASLDAQKEERYRIAKQLHDGIGGNLAGIKLQLANVKNTVKSQKDIMNQVNETYELVRDISHDLVPKKFNQYAFTILIENYIEQLQKNTEIEIVFSTHPKDKINDLPKKLKVALYQTLQELFTNTIKHAGASSVEVHLTIHDAILQLLFEDNGNGFEAGGFAKGIGLQNIESRLQQLGGISIIDSAPQRGTAITIEIPLKENT